MKSIINTVKRWFTRRYELTITYPSDSVRPRRSETVILSRVDRLTNKTVKGRDEHGLQYELSSETAFDYVIRRIH